MDKLLAICNRYGIDHKLVHNSLRSNVTCFKLKDINLERYPAFEFAEENIEFVTQCKCLGTIVENNCSKLNQTRLRVKSCSKEVKSVSNHFVQIYTVVSSDMKRKRGTTKN